MTQKLAINWHPPTTLYIYQADLYCPDCAHGIEHDLTGQGFALCQGMDDSECWPVEYSSRDGESDSPDHCGSCHRFLGRALTDDGVEYVRQAVMDDLDQYGTVREVVQGWLDFYAIDLASIPGYYGVDGIDLASAVGIERD